MKVKLLDHTKLSNAVIGARTCWGSFHKGGNCQLLGNKFAELD